MVTRNELADLRDRLLEVTDAMGDAGASLEDGIGADTVLSRLLAALDGTLGQNG